MVHGMIRSVESALDGAAEPYHITWLEEPVTELRGTAGRPAPPHSHPCARR